MYTGARSMCPNTLSFRTMLAFGCMLAMAKPSVAQSISINFPPILGVEVDLGGQQPPSAPPLVEQSTPPAGPVETITEVVSPIIPLNPIETVTDIVNPVLSPTGPVETITEILDPLLPPGGPVEVINEVIDPLLPIELPPIELPAIPIRELTIPGTSITVNPNALLAPIAQTLDVKQTGGVLNQIGGLAQTVSGIVSTGGGIVDQLLSGGIGGNITDGIIGGLADGNPASSSAANTISAPSVIAPTTSTFMISGVLVNSHDGFDAKSSDANASGRTAGFDAVSYGFTTGVRTDASDLFGLDKGRVTYGFFGNFTHTDVDTGVSDALQGLGLNRGGEASVDSWSAGGFALVTAKAFYGLAVITGTFGQSEVTNFLIGSGSEFDSVGFSTSAVGGWLAPVGKTAKLDISGRLTYAASDIDDYKDSGGVVYHDTSLDDVSVTASARLFDSIPGSWATYRPFIQTGVTHRIDHTNEIKVDGVKFEFDDADTTVFGRIGVDFEVQRTVQAYIALRGDVSEDAEAVAGQVGVTFRLD